MRIEQMRRGREFFPGTFGYVDGSSSAHAMLSQVFANSGLYSPALPFCKDQSPLELCRQCQRSCSDVKGAGKEMKRRALAARSQCGMSREL